MIRRSGLCAIVALTSLSLASPTQAQETTQRSVRALMVTGGCCHDYQNQKKLISAGLSEYAGPIDWTILEYSSERDIQADVYKQKDWIKDFDIVIHNECFGAVEDGEFVQAIVDAHTLNKIPAIMIHCSMHSYRNAPTADAWRGLLGVTSRRHEKSKHPLNVVTSDFGKSHPIMNAVGDSFDTPNGELYIIEKVWPSTKVLATAYSAETKKDEPVIWINEIEGTKVFGISLGHHNETIDTKEWQSIVASGWKWALE